MMQAATPSLAEHDAGLPSALAPRAARARATLTDLGALLVGGVLAFLVGVVYLLARTSWGVYDVGDFDSALAAALLLAVPPTWAARLLLSLGEHGATPGQRRAGLVIARRQEGWRRARLLRLALHPISVPVWLWAAAMLALLAVPVLPWLLALWCGLLVIGTLASILLFAFRPATPAVHDWVARTRLVERP